MLALLHTRVLCINIKFTCCLAREETRKEHNSTDDSRCHHNSADPWMQLGENALVGQHFSIHHDPRTCTRPVPRHFGLFPFVREIGTPSHTRHAKVVLRFSLSATSCYNLSPLMPEFPDRLLRQAQAEYPLARQMKCLCNHVSLRQILPEQVAAIPPELCGSRMKAAIFWSPSFSTSMILPASAFSITLRASNWDILPGRCVIVISPASGTYLSDVLIAFSTPTMPQTMLAKRQAPIKP